MKTKSRKFSKSQPQNVRFEVETLDELLELSTRTGLPIGDLIRRCVHFSLPKFAEGEANLLEYGRPSNGKEAA